jgi:hypothetical protein
LTDDAMSDARTVAPYLNCPRCGLSIRPRTAWLAISHCPRCIARSRTLVELFRSRLPAEVLYASHLLPRAYTTGRSGRESPQIDLTFRTSDLATTVAISDGVAQHGKQVANRAVPTQTRA